MITCNDCESLRVTEEEQLINKYAQHRCNMYYLKVFHKGSKYKPEDHNIYPCKICSGAKFKHR